MDRVRLPIALLLVVLVAASLASLSCSNAKQPSTSDAVPASADPVARGRYLTTTMGCNDCHTPGYFYGAPDTTRLLSGSDLGWVGPWGVVHARNLTPDSTGIGAWTAEQIVQAIRTGNTPDGRQLAPIMPWTDFAHLTDDDAMAIASFLKSLPPIHHVNLPVIPPGQKPTGSNVVFPPPPAWDAQNLPAPPK